MAPFLNPWASEFRHDLVEQDESLANLQSSVQRLGLSWIESYLEAVFDNHHENEKPAIGDLIKTPSRKKGKTRATTAQAKDRQDKLKTANTNQSTNQTKAPNPASPQQPRTAKVVKIASISTSPQPFQSTSAPLSPLRAGSSRANNNTLLHALQQAQQSPTKDSKGKSRAKAIVIEEDEQNENDQSVPASKKSKPVAGGKKKKPTKKDKPAANKDDQPMDVFVEVPTLEELDKAEKEQEHARPSPPPSRSDSPANEPVEAVLEPIDPTDEDGTEAEAVNVSVEIAQEDDTTIVPPVGAAVQPEDIVLPSSELSPVEEDAPSAPEPISAQHSRASTIELAPTTAEDRPTSPAVIEPLTAPKADTIDSSSPPRPSGSPARSAEPTVEEVAPATSTTVVAQATAGPSSSAKVSSWPNQRSTATVGLRSSWLSKALGGDGQDGLRKSQGTALVAASREREKEREEQIAASAAAGRTSGQLAVSGPSSSQSQKRKSGDAFLDTSSTSIDPTQSQSQPSQVDDSTGRAAKYQRANDIAASAHRLSTLPSASNIPGRLPILFSPPSTASTAADNQSGISRLKKEIEELAARNARTRALSSLGGTSLPPAPAPAALRMSLAQRGTQLANVGESDPQSPTPRTAPVVAPVAASPPSEAGVTSPVAIVEDKMTIEAEIDEDEDEYPEPPMPDLATPFESPVRELLPPPPMVVQAIQLPSTPPPAPIPAKKSLLVQQPVVAPAVVLAPKSEVNALVTEKTVEPEVFPFPSSPIEAPAVKLAAAPRPEQPPVARQAPAGIPRMPERVAPTAPPSRQHNRQPTTPVQADRYSAALLNEMGSTTPSQTPPTKSKVPVPSSKVNRDQPKEDGDLSIEDLVMTSEKTVHAKQPAKQDVDENADDEQEEDDNMSESRVTRASTLSNSLTQSTANSRLGASTSSQSVYAHGSKFAAKALGKKAVAEPVKALALAAEAAKKEQAAKDRKAAISRLAEARRNHAMVKKSQEEKAKADEEKRVRAAELAERKAKTAELERKRKEREERERRLKADEDASKKRKLAASTNASATADKNGAPEPKRFASSSSSTNNPTQQPKQLVSKLSKSNLATSAGLSGLPPKPVVPSFRHLPPSSSSSSNAVQRPSNAPTSNNVPSASTSTIRVIPAMGPPIRPSDMNKTLGHGHANRASQAPSGPSSNSAASILLLAQQRQALQSHIASQNIQPSDAAESEAIELPDIKSEYSDSDDEDRPNKGASLPAWAQSPEIRSALREQESFNPDDVFGPMKPLSMEEVFRARAGKFRARSSSANWGGQDRLTEREEMEYARRMGFK